MQYKFMARSYNPFCLLMRHHVRLGLIISYSSILLLRYILQINLSECCMCSYVKCSQKSVCFSQICMHTWEKHTDLQCCLTNGEHVYNIISSWLGSYLELEPRRSDCGIYMHAWVLQHRYIETFHAKKDKTTCELHVHTWYIPFARFVIL